MVVGPDCAPAVAAASLAFLARMEAEATQHQGDRQGQGDEGERRQDDADQARHGQQAEGQPEVGDGDAGGAPALELGHAGAQDGRTSADDDGKQVGQRSEQDLEGEADDEDRRQRTVVVGEGGPRAARGEDQPMRAEADGQPQEPGAGGQGGEGVGRRRRAAVMIGR